MLFNHLVKRLLLCLLLMSSSQILLAQTGLNDELLQQKINDLLSQSAQTKPGHETKEQRAERLQLELEGLKQLFIKNLEKQVLEYKRSECRFETEITKNIEEKKASFCIKHKITDFFLSDYMTKVKVSYQQSINPNQAANKEALLFDVSYFPDQRKLCIDHNLTRKSLIKIYFPEGFYQEMGNKPCSEQVIESEISFDLQKEIEEEEEARTAPIESDKNPIFYRSGMSEREYEKELDLCIDIYSQESAVYWSRPHIPLFFKKTEFNEYLSSLRVKVVPLSKLNSIKHKELKEADEVPDHFFKTVSVQAFKPYLAYSSERQDLYNRFVKNKEETPRPTDPVANPKFFEQYDLLCLKNVDANSFYKIEFTQPITIFDRDYNKLKSKFEASTAKTHKLSPKLSTLTNKFILPPGVKEIPIYYQNLKKLHAKIFAVDQKNLAFLMNYYDQSVLQTMKSVNTNRMPYLAKSDLYQNYYHNDDDYNYDYDYDYDYDERQRFQNVLSALAHPKYQAMITLLSQQYGQVIWEGIYELPENPNAKNEDLKASLPLNIDTVKYPNHFFFLLLENDDMQTYEKLSKINNQLPDYLKKLQSLSYPTDAEVPGPILSEKQVHAPDIALIETEEEYQSTIISDLGLLYIQKLLCILPASFGIHSVETNQGHHIKVLALDQEKPIPNVKVSLVAQNNRIIDSKQTDELGSVFFPSALFEGQDGNRVHLIYAENQAGELLILDLESHRLDMIAKTSVGWDQQHGMVWLNRGIYRLGEEIHTLINTRDSEGKGKSLPVLMRLTKGSGFYSENITEELIYSELIVTNELGVAETIVQIPENNTSGSWALSIYDYRKLKAMYPLLKQAKTDEIDQWLYTGDVDVEEALLDRQEFKVDYIKPAEFKLKTKILTPPDLSKPSPKTPPYQLEVEGKYHFGGNLENVKVETDVFFAKIKQPLQFKKSGYYFGVEKEPSFENLNILEPILLNQDGMGIIHIPSLLKPDSYSPRILKAKLRVFENGRSFEKIVQLPVNLRNCEIGVKLFSERVELEEADRVFFSIVTTNYLGEPLAKQKLKVIWERKFYKEDRIGRRQISSHYQPYLTEEIETDENGEFMLYSRPLEYDYYRLKIQHTTDGAVTLLPFIFQKNMQDESEADQGEEESEDVADRYSYGPVEKDQILNYELFELNGKVDQSALKVKKEVTVHIDYPANGYAIYQLVDQKDIIWKHEQQVTKGQLSTTIPIPESLSIGANLMVQFIRDTNPQMLSVPKRMLFNSWIPVNREQFETEFKITATQNRLPSSSGIDIPYEINKAPNEKMFVSFWFVDNAILDFTNYQLKSILKHVFSPRTIPLKIYDIYMHVLEYFQEYPKAKVKFGGDLFIDMDSMKDNDKILSLRSGIITVPDSGKGTVHLDIPKFEGKARLIGYAFGEKRFANTEHIFTVRNHFVIDIFSPDFLTLSDESVLNLSAHYFGEKETDVKITLSANQDVLAVENQEWNIKMKPNDSLKKSIPVKLNQYGEGVIHVKVDVPGEKVIEEKFTIQSRPAWNKQNFRKLVELKPDQTLTFSPFENQDFLAYTTQFNLMINHMPLINIKEILKDLNDYPYGCAEQLTSKTFPQLYFEKLFKIYDIPYDGQKVGKQIQDGLKELTTLSHYEHGMVLWEDTDLPVSLEIAAYILHFISDHIRLTGNASTLNLSSSRDQLLRRLIDPTHYRVLEEKISTSKLSIYNEYDLAYDQFEALYALYVLSAYQLISKEDALTRLSVFKPKMLSLEDVEKVSSFSGSYSYFSGYYEIKTLMYHLLNRLVYHGILAQFNIEIEQSPMPIDQYLEHLQQKQLLSDQVKLLAQMTFFATQSKLYNGLKNQCLKVLAKTLDERLYLSTQDQAWIVIASAKVTENRLSTWQAEYQGKAIQSKGIFQDEIRGASAMLAKTIKNTSKDSIWIQYVSSGFSKTAPATIDQGLNIVRKIYTDEGMLVEPVNGKYQFKEGEVIIVDLNVTIKKNHPMIKEGVLLKELLPGGWMLLTENQYYEFMKQMHDNKNAHYDVSSRCNLTKKIKKVDRVVYVFDFSKNFDLTQYPDDSYLNCHFSYVVSNQFKGTFAIPGAYAEIMNDPNTRGLLGQEQLEIIK